MTTAELLVRLTGVRQTATGYEARCSAHEDHKPSLGVTTGTDGRILLHCHAGCSTGAVVTALGLKMSDLFPDKAKPTIAPRIVATYNYKDEQGKLLFQAVRFEPKGFRQRRPDPAKPDQWVWNLKDTRRVLYRLPEVIAAVKAGHGIFIVEGEKDADALGKAGFVATTCPMGAGKWLPEHTEALRGAKRVAIIADKDAPGRKHAAEVANALRAVVGHVRLIELPDRDGKTVKDAADWFAAGGAADELRDLLKAAPPYVPAPPEPPVSTAGTPPSGSLAAASDASPSQDEATLQRLAALSPLEFDRQAKTAADTLGVSATTLRSEVSKRRGKPATDSLQGSAVDLTDTEPWPDPVEGAAVLCEVAGRFQRYVALPAGAADTLALWCAHAHTFKAFVCSPRLNINSPEPRCGKTTLRDVLALFVPRPLPTENLTPAVLFRLVESKSPTILADEYDAWLRENEELRGLLNAGHRRGGTVYRCEGDSHEIRSFGVFSPAVLCGIGALPGTVQDRSIEVRLVRAKPGELHARFDSRRTDPERELCRKLVRWCADHAEALEACDPDLPGEAYNRLADNWRPLFAVAELAGGDWPARCAAAFDRLTSQSDTDAEGQGAMLLADIRPLFVGSRRERIFSCDIVKALCAMTDRPWPEAHRGRPINEHWLGRRLAGFGIKSRTLRIETERAKGYEAADFADSFERYLAPEGDSKRDNVTTPANTGLKPASKSVTALPPVTDSKAEESPAGIGLSRGHASNTPPVATRAEEAMLL